MGIHHHFTTTLAVVGGLAAAGASVARAQDTSATARSDTMGYQPSEGQVDTARSDTARASRADSGNFQYNGPPSDAALRAEPGVQAGEAGRPDTVVCKDGSTAAAKMGCSSHGGIDWASTKAVMKARGGVAAQPGDSTAMPADTTQAGYQQHGAPSDTALRTKPGTQTGPDTGAVKAETGMGREQGP